MNYTPKHFSNSKMGKRSQKYRAVAQNGNNYLDCYILQLVKNSSKFKNFLFNLCIVLVINLKIMSAFIIGRHKKVHISIVNC